MRDKEFHIDFPVFADYRVNVIVTQDIEKCMKKRKDCAGIEFEGDEAAITVHDEDVPQSLIIFGKHTDIGTITHESWHALFNMFKHMGAQLEEETVAYHLGYLVNEIVKRVMGRKR